MRYFYFSAHGEGKEKKYDGGYYVESETFLPKDAIRKKMAQDSGLKIEQIIIMSIFEFKNAEDYSSFLEKPNV